jgi:hypothetical protein
MNRLRSRPALGLAVVAAVIAAAAAAVLAGAGEEDGPELAATTATSADGLPAAPWSAAAVPRRAVPPAFAEAWERARNRDTCALLFPLDGGPEMEGALATAERIPDDNGWDILLAGEAATIEVLGLFDKAGRTGRAPGTGGFTRTWSDGSVARYGPDAGGRPPDASDAGAAPFEAVLTLPDQACAYRIYDTLGKDHLEATFDRLRLMARG